MRSIYFAFSVVLIAGASNCLEEKLFRSDYQYFTEADGWFKLHQMPLNWQEARLRCAYEGTMLASPTNYGLTAVIRSLAAKQKVVVYTGIHSTLSSGDFNSLDATPLSEIPVKWRPGNPDNQNNNENCIVYHGQGLVEDVDCNRPFPYICYKKHSKSMIMTECGTIDTEYKMDLRTNKCYKFHRFGRSHSLAAAVCTAEGGHLAIVNSETEAEVLTNLIAEHPAKTNAVSHPDLIRLGFYNWNNSNFFGTLDGQTLQEAGYSKWMEGEPNYFYQGHQQGCGAMYRNGLLDDTTCSDNLAFVCEKHPDTLRISTIDIRFGEGSF